jgi:hypothetical protein
MSVMPSIKSHLPPVNKNWLKARQREIGADLEYAWALMENWPHSWEIDEGDRIYGEGLLQHFKPFVRHLVETEQLSRSTLRRHLNNLWLLGGELISLINTYDEDRKRSPDRLLDDNLSSEGGPSTPHAQPGPPQRQYDATCKKLHAFRSGLAQAHKYR